MPRNILYVLSQQSSPSPTLPLLTLYLPPSFPCPPPASTSPSPFPFLSSPPVKSYLALNSSSSPSLPYHPHLWTALLSVSLSPEFAPCPQEVCGFVVLTQRWFKPHEVTLWHTGAWADDTKLMALGLTLYLISDEQFLPLHWTLAHARTHTRTHTHTHTHHTHTISMYSFPHAVLNS